jgi:hypothetical protein
VASAIATPGITAQLRTPAAPMPLQNEIRRHS